MKRYHGDEHVDPGIYLHLRHLSFKSLEDEGTLPGGGLDTYVRVPALLLLVVGPLMGLAYVIFLPLVGFVMLAAFLAGKAAEVATEAAAASARVLRPAWEPARAFLARTKVAKKAGEKAAKREDRWAEEARKEVEEDEERKA